MRASRLSLSRSPAAFRLVVSLAVVMNCGSILADQASAALATGSVTAHVFLCPERVSFGAVRQSPSESPLLAACTPFDSGSAFLQLRLTPAGPQLAGVQLAKGVLRWPTLEFGDYAFGGFNAPDEFGSLLVTTGDGVPVAGQERASISIASDTLHVERHFYLFPEARADEGR